ncbi:phosphatase 1 beta [Raphidocelis subcapitata]|uniref:Serine/threonine-protein phosphatase n=1 Tax=Raphidocelis subcapitata TaxID=307507 RepID=A0A2V0NNK5_9CHLO|nr:phosphatase 1 beta [Raphidocelis subcapitata]|eukprot:GBF89161.1 phosphatase 1 beta [Raphidocelis subcapitata]
MEVENAAAVKAAAQVARPRPFSSEGVAPGPRCGHTLTAVPDLNRLVLFGGATALEGSSQKNADGTNSNQGAAASGIRLAGATNDVHVFEVKNGKWEKITPLGEAPSPRAAHAAAAVGNMVVVQGGIGPAGLASEDLHVLDFTDPERPRWHRVLVQGAGPSARYAHTLSLVANRFLVAMGGNDGKSTLGDAWALDTSEKPYAWRKITDAGDMPCPRMYATAAARSDGLLLLCGGRDVQGTPLADAYGFARHRDGRWEWHAAPGSMPSGRYQHGAVFVGARLHISGGAVGGGRMVDEATSTVMLDTSGGAWITPSTASLSGDDLTRRCRHAVASLGPFVFVYGGLKGSQLLDDLLLADDSGGTELTVCDPRSPAWSRYLNSVHGSANAAQLLAEAAAAEAAAAAAMKVKEEAGMSDDASDASPVLVPRDESPTLTLAQRRAGATPPTPDVRLYHRAVVAPMEPPLRGLVRQLSIDQLDNEGRRVSIYDKGLPADGAAGGTGPGEGRGVGRGGGYGAPNTAGDITYIDYLFLGDYVDRGSHSLETICLLLALKVEYPRSIHLIRGNHEAADINALFGFRLECLERLGDEDGIWVWKRINALFNWLPLAALIEGKILCMHGGIGRCINQIDQIAALQRPITMEEGGPVLMDLLWSDPTTNDGVQGVQPSPRGPGLVTFGPDRVKDFCKKNGLQMIVRAHECVMDGFERFAQGHLITLFSATNYCGTAGNAGAILVLGRDLVMVPKLIHPVPPTTPRTPDSGAALDEDAPAAAAPGSDTWMTQVNEERPPTPPRGRPHTPGSSLEYF